ncbi:MAG: hypothetical protein MZW92_75270 [Comamonadaceae bacterium]|nr:hypothetical protein [Comamonadaceae bacterium]
MHDRKQAESDAGDGRSAQGRVSRHARARAQEPAGADPQCRGTAGQDGEPGLRRPYGRPASSGGRPRCWPSCSTTCSTWHASRAARSR